MKSIVPILIAGWLSAVNALGQNQAPTAQSSTLNYLPSTTNHVLDLDGKESYVELPPSIFTNLTQGTVEAWVKWRSPGVPYYSARPFVFGPANKAMGIVMTPTAGLNFYVNTAGTSYGVLTPDGLIELRMWYHIAAVSGPSGMKFYCNGVLLGTNVHTGSFSGIPGGPNFLGRWHDGRANQVGETTFNGQIDEFRVWNHERNEQQIRANMLKTLTGKEAGLVALWNFNDGTANDSSTNAFHGRFVGNAKVVEAQLPLQAAFVPEKVLALEGKETCVELPPNIFTNLTAATIETWVKCAPAGFNQRFFTFGLPNKDAR